MDLEQIRKERKIVEEALLDLLTEFESRTGVSVTEVKYTKITVPVHTMVPFVDTKVPMVTGMEVEKYVSLGVVI